MNTADMDIHAACHSILGDDLANSIILDMGIHWAVIAAMAEANTDDDPRALAAIRKWNAEHTNPSEPRT